MGYGMRGSYPFRYCRTLDDELPYPHYSDPTWDTYQLVFGTEEGESDGGGDSDRLVQWNYAASELGGWSVPSYQHGTPRGKQTYLSTYNQRPVNLKSIHAITNRATAYTVWSYAWRWAGDPYPVQTNRACFWIGAQFNSIMYSSKGGEAKLVVPAELVTPEVQEVLEQFNRYQGFGKPHENTKKPPMSNWVWTINVPEMERLIAQLNEWGWTRTDNINNVW